MVENNKAAISLIAVTMLMIGFISDEVDAYVLDNIETIEVNAVRTNTDLYKLPFAVDVVPGAQVQRYQQQLSLDESLAAVPGLHLQNRYNFAQDTRISIRGFGARGNFGVRGIKILVDGIPSTMADGQGQTDSLDLGSVGRIEVIKGSGSYLYGNASGGVINILTQPAPDMPQSEIRLTAGQHGYSKYQFKSAGTHERMDYLVSASQLAIDGFRQHSKAQNTVFSSKLNLELQEGGELSLLLNLFNSPISQDPGALNRLHASSMPQSAYPANLLFNAGEELNQQKLGVKYEYSPGQGQQLTGTTFYQRRSFTNRLPFEEGGQVNFDREFFGASAQYSNQHHAMSMNHLFTLGIDIERQVDDRQRFDNLAGKTGALRLDQHESVDSIGLFALSQLQMTPAVLLNLGLRLDRQDFGVDDYFLQDGQDSGSISYNNLSASAGLLYQQSDILNWYANLSSGFETPTFTEFANPSGGGFNPQLTEQNALSAEVGVKGRTADWSYQLAVYRIDIDDELIPYELAEQPGRTFYRNAGESLRTGVEMGFNWQASTHLALTTAYTYSDYRFRRFVVDGIDLSNHDAPGIPKQNSFIELQYNGLNDMLVSLSYRRTGAQFANNQNNTRIPAFGETSLRIGIPLRFGDIEIDSFLAVNNLFDQQYPANVRINAFAGRYFEPAPGRNLYFGASLRF